MNNIGSNILKLRKLRGVTQAQLAKKIKKDRSVIARYERGDVKVSVDVVLSIANALRFPIAKFFDKSA